MIKKPNIFPNIRFRLFEAVFFLSLFLVSLPSCKKDALIKTGVQPESENLNLIVTDTFTIEAQSYHHSSIINSGVDFGLIGFDHDPVFGFTTCESTVQFVPSSETLTLTSLSNVKIESVKLSFALNGVYGDNSNTDVEYELYEVDDSISVDKTYTSSDAINLNPIPVSSTTGIDDSNSDLSNGFYGVLSFDLDTLVGYNMLSLLLQTPTDEEFLKEFNGFKVVPKTATTNHIWFSDLTHANTKLTVSYIDGTTAGTYTFVVNEFSSARINSFVHDYSTGSILGSLNNIEEGKEQVFVQDMAGIGTKISIPHLNNLYKGYPISVNKAEFIFTIQEGSSTSERPNHGQLRLGPLDEDGDDGYNQDEIEGRNVGGIFNSATNEYKINLTRHFQVLFEQLHQGNNQYFGFSLLPLNPEQGSFRTILDGTEPTNGSKIRFVLSYSEIK